MMVDKSTFRFSNPQHHALVRAAVLGGVGTGNGRIILPHVQFGPTARPRHVRYGFAANVSVFVEVGSV